MTTQKSNQNLIWIDLEMTGLDPEQERIIEIATIITDSNLTIIAEGPNLIIHQWQEKLKESDRRMKQTVINYIKAITVKAESMNNKLQLLNPDAHLKRGFAIATDINNQIVYSPEQTDVNDLIQLKVARGKIAAKVVNIEGSDD